MHYFPGSREHRHLLGGLTATIGAVCSGTTLFAPILNSSVMLGSYLQQTTLADDICSFLAL